MNCDQAKSFIETIAAEKRRQDSADLRGALRLLAEELNAKESHFILELIQNAEDNDYDCDEPELSLQIVEGNLTEADGVTTCLVFLNNERGFRAENVQSLSSVGNSTKKKGTNSGHIGEKGIGFKSVFRVTDEPHIFSGPFQFKFRKPTEAEPLGYILPHWVDTVPTEIKPGFTAIILPLLPGRTQNIAGQIQKIAPETLLFLRKIRTLRLGVNGEITVRGTAPRLHLTGGDGRSEYFVVATRFGVPQRAQDERRRDVTDHEITIAFPIQQQIRTAASVFAFLPTEINSGLPFLINADFIVNSSREGILEERPWNVYARDRIGDAFIQTFLRILDDPDLRESGHRFLPSWSDVNRVAPFFQPVLDCARTGLRNLLCVLTDSGELALPAKIVFASDHDRKLLKGAPQQCSVPFMLHPAWNSSWSERLRPIGVGKLSLESILAAFNDSAWLERKNADWWIQFLECCKEHSATAMSFGQLPVLKCQDGPCRSARSPEVYLHPLQDRGSDEIAPGWPAARFLDREVQIALGGQPALWKWFRDTFGLPDFSVENYILNSLLNWIRNQAGQGRIEEVVRATLFVAQNLPESQESRRQIAKRMFWVFDNGSSSITSAPVPPETVTPDGFSFGFAWAWVFVTREDRSHFNVLHSAYSKNSDPKANKALWELMQLAEITDVPRPPLRRGPDGEADYTAPRWLQDLGRIRKPEDVSARLDQFELWLRRHAKSGSLERLLTTQKQSRLPTSFGATVRSVPWLATTNGFQAPEVTFLDTPETRSFLSQVVPYSTSSLDEAILVLVGIQKAVSAQTLIPLLRRLRDGNLRQDEMVLHKMVLHIYQRLRTESFNVRVFAAEPLIWLAFPESRWFNSGEVVWKDYGTALDGLLWSAERTYGNEDLHGFFLTNLGVSPEASQEFMVTLWSKISHRIPESNDFAKSQLEPIYRAIADGAFLDQPLWLELKGSLRIWKTRGDFGEPGEVFLPDSGFAARIFEGLAPIAWLPSQIAKGMIDVLLAAGCRSIRQSLRTRLSLAADDPPSLREPRLLTPASKELILLLVTKRRQLSKLEIALRALFNTCEYLVGEVSVVYSLQDSPWRKPEQVAAFWSADDSQLMVSKGADLEDQRTAAARFIAGAFFDDDTDAEAIVFSLLTKSATQAKYHIVDQKWEFTEPAQTWLTANGIESCLGAHDGVDLKCSASGPTPRFNFQKESPKSPGPPLDPGSNGSAPSTAPTKSARDAASDSNGNLTAKGAGASGGSDRDLEDVLGDVDSDLYQITTDSEEMAERRPVKYPHDQRATLPKPPPDQSRPDANGPANPGNRSRPGGPGAQRRPNSRQMPTRNSEVEKAAMAHVKDVLTRLFPGCEIHDVSQRRDHGHDLLVKIGNWGLRIEVKGHAGATSSFVVTPIELKESRRGGSKYQWELWNVTHLASDQPVTIRRYSEIPVDAIITETGLRIDLSRCRPITASSNR